MSEEPHPQPGTASGTTSITTVGEGQAAGTPDTLRLHVAVHHTAASVSDALAGCASRLEAAVAVANQFTEPHRIGSTGLHVDREHDEQGRAGTGWVAHHALRIEVPDVAASGDLVTALAEGVGEALRIGHVEMYLADPGDLAVQARAAAFDDARAKAEELAALAGRRVTDVVAVAEGAGARPYVAGEVAPAAMSRAGTSFEPGSATVSAALTVVWSTAPA
jgi:uncharacterized protein YggE